MDNFRHYRDAKRLDQLSREKRLRKNNYVLLSILAVNMQELYFYETGRLQVESKSRVRELKRLVADDIIELKKDLSKKHLKILESYTDRLGCTEYLDRILKKAI